MQIETTFSRYGWITVAIFLLASPAFAQPDEEEAGPFAPLFKVDTDQKPIRLVPADGYYQVGTPLVDSLSQAYRWEYWALHPDGTRLARMASAGGIPSRLLLDPRTGVAVGAIDFTLAPQTVVLINRYGRQIKLDLCLGKPGDKDLRSPYPLYKVKQRGRSNEPLFIEDEPIGWIDDLQEQLLDEDDEPVAKLENARFTELGSRMNQHAMIFAGRSLSSDLFTATPSTALLARLGAIMNTLGTATSTEAKLFRIQLGARWLQVSSVLAKNDATPIGAPRELIEAVRTTFAAKPLDELNDLWRSETRKVLWDALSASHPLYQYFAEGAGLAGLRDDPEVLEQTLRLLKASWIKGSNAQVKVKRQGPLEDWMRDGLIDGMRFQAIRSPQEAISLAADFKVVPPSIIGRPRAIGDPPVIKGQPAAALRAANQATAFDLGMHQAAALQRSGRDVTLWSLAIEKHVDDTTKTVVQEPLIVFPKQSGKPVLVAIGTDYFLARMKGRKIADGYYEFASGDDLNPLLESRAQFKVAMADVFDAQPTVNRWGDGIQRALMKVVGNDPIIMETLLDATTADPWDSFNQQAAASLETHAQKAFLRLIQNNSIELSIQTVREGTVIKTDSIPDVLKRSAEHILPKHEAILGRCFQMLPNKMESGLRFISLRTEPIKEIFPSAVIEDGKLTVKPVEQLLIGRGGANRIMLAAPRFPEAYHELMHRWANARTEPYKIGDLLGNVIEPFNQISWERSEKGFGWDRRSGDRFNIEDFWWDYGATNEREDFAVIGQFYGAMPKVTRLRIRSEMRTGNLTPAAKYLYFKAITFLDTDGKMLEIDIDEADKPFSFAEFEKGVRSLEKKQGSLTEEQQRIRTLIERVKALHGLLLDKKVVLRRS